MLKEKECLIKFEPDKKGITVTYVGDWQRSDVDKSYVAMFKELPRHIVARREKLKKEKEKSDD